VSGEPRTGGGSRPAVPAPSRIAVVADHNGLALKARLTAWLAARGHAVDDRGPAGEPGEPVDYPPLCADVCRQVLTGDADKAIVLGGSGLGETIACNKMPGIRAGLCHDEWTALVSRGHNDANVLVLPAKTLSAEAAERILAVWLDTAFLGGVHQRRLDQIAALERETAHRP
jgi:ribose 5-phosphate isomerase B